MGNRMRLREYFGAGLEIVSGALATSIADHLVRQNQEAGWTGLLDRLDLALGPASATAPNDLVAQLERMMAAPGAPGHVGDL